MSYTYGTIAAGGGTFTLGTVTDSSRPTSPKGLIATQAVETRAGWLGQVFVDKAIVFESTEPHDKSEDAIAEANERVVRVITNLFTAAEGTP